MLLFLCALSSFSFSRLLGDNTDWLGLCKPLLPLLGYQKPSRKQLLFAGWLSFVVSERW